MPKKYATVWIPEHHRSVRLHRHVAAELLGRPLFPSEVVHHIDGDSLNNAPDNLLVLPSQRHHASLEQYLRRLKRGQPTLFPHLLEADRGWTKGTLFQHIGWGNTTSTTRATASARQDACFSSAAPRPA